MAVQMFLIQPKDMDDENVRETLAEYIVQRGGFILMATSYGSLIAAYDDVYADDIKHHYLVNFASGVTLDPNAPGAAALQQIFVQNIAAQLVERGIQQPGHVPVAQPPDPGGSPFPPGYRPLRWSTRSYLDEEEGGE